MIKNIGFGIATIGWLYGWSFLLFGVMDLGLPFWIMFPSFGIGMVGMVIGLIYGLFLTFSKH
jgi:hypothetical protein